MVIQNSKYRKKITPILQLSGRKPYEKLVEFTTVL